MNRRLNRNLDQVTLGILLGFLIVALSLVYWSVIQSDSMLARDDNPRRVEDERALLRGGIYDRADQLLARTVIVGKSPSGKSVVRREYPSEAISSVTGYYSLIYGVGGAEAVYDTQLRGDDLRSPLQVRIDSLLHRSQVGSDIRLTVDASLQKTIMDSFKGKQGAAVVLDVPSGAVLAMVSAPTFDPNVLDTTFRALDSDPAAPMLNRATQGLFQPGGSLQTVLLAALLTERIDVTVPISGAKMAVQVDGRALNCIGTGEVTTLAEAYSQACPAPFADVVASKPGPVAAQKMIQAFGLLRPPPLEGFDTISGKEISLTTQTNNPILLQAQGVGQGDLTVTPLQMALVAATVANRGNLITPYLADAIRKPGATWQALPVPQRQSAAISQEVAATISDMLKNNVSSGTARPAQRANLTIRGHASIAYTGPSQQQAAWFIGYVDRPNGRTIAIAVVIEGVDAAFAADVGGTALAWAAR